MGRKNIILSESQVRRLMEIRIDEISAENVAEKIKNIPCTGRDFKTELTELVLKQGYEDVRIKYLGHDDNVKNMMYLVYTEGPIFNVKVSGSSEEKPCLSVFEVNIYNKI